MIVPLVYSERMARLTSMDIGSSIDQHRDETTRNCRLFFLSAVEPRELGGNRAVEGRLDGREQLWLVVLHGQQVVAFLFANRCGVAFLAAARVERHQRAPQVQQGQQRRNRGLLVGEIGHRLLTQQQARLGVPGADEMQDATEIVGRRAVQRLAVNGDVRLRVEPPLGRPLYQGGSEWV